MACLLAAAFSAQPVPALVSALERLHRVGDEKEVAFSQAIEDIKKADLVFVGEEHGNGLHHRALIEIAEALRQSGREVVVGLEMFMARSQPALHDWVSGRMGLDRFVSVYAENWDYPWPSYRSVFLYAREKGVPLIGLNVPREITRKVAATGFASLTDEELRELPPGLTCDVDEEYIEFIRKIYKTHDEGRSFVYFCEAQMVWDKTMAHNLMEFLKVRPGAAVVVLAGINHSWKRGIPEQVRRQSDYAFRVFLPENPAVPPEMISFREADYIFLSPD